MSTVRRATQDAVGRMTELAALKRKEYESYEPVMWRTAKDAETNHAAWLSRLVDDESHVCIVHERNDRIDGFIIGKVQPAPPIYDPGGLTCVVDDFVVEDSATWNTTGARLLGELTELVRAQGVSQLIVVAGHKDGPKRDMLRARSYSLASEWYTLPLATPPSEHEIKEHELKTPEDVLLQLTGFWRTAIMRAAFDLNLVDHILDGRDTVRAIAEAENADPRTLKILMDAFCALGFADRAEDHYTIDQQMARLLRHRPGSVADIAAVWANDLLWKGWGSLTEAIRLGRPVEDLELEHPYWDATFARATFALAHQSGKRILPKLNIQPGARTRILDVGCGSGGFGYALALADESSTVTGIDGEGVLMIARQNAAELGIEDRVTLRSGDITTQDLGNEEFDIAVLSNLLHLFPPETAGSIVERTFRALRPGGCVVISEYLPDDDRRLAALPLMFGVFMTVISGGNAYTYPEILEWLKAAGLENEERHDMPGFFTMITARRQTRAERAESPSTC